MTRGEALALHGRLSQELADRYRDRGQVAQAENEAKTGSYMAHRQLPVTEREQMAKAAAAKFTGERIVLDADCQALEAQIAYLTLAIQYGDG